jgi:hypothetical protein
MKLRKRLPESRSEKRERLKSEKQNRVSDRELALRRKELWLRQQDESLEVWKQWRRAVKHRLDSDDAYRHFEETHLALWDWFRHAGMPGAEATLAMQRRADGLPFDIDPIVDWIASGPRRADATLWDWVARAELDDPQRAAVGAMVLRVVDLPFWFRGFSRLRRLARAIDSAWLRRELEKRAAGDDDSAQRARMLRDAFSQGLEGRGES